jgi:hypothetical protein
MLFCSLPAAFLFNYPGINKPACLMNEWRGIGFKALTSPKLASFKSIAVSIYIYIYSFRSFEYLHSCSALYFFSFYLSLHPLFWLFPSVLFSSFIYFSFLSLLFSFLNSPFILYYLNFLYFLAFSFSFSSFSIFYLVLLSLIISFFRYFFILSSAPLLSLFPSQLSLALLYIVLFLALSLPKVTKMCLLVSPCPLLCPLKERREALNAL